MSPELICLAGNPELQDRVEFFRADQKIIIALADGAGGLSGGARAAEIFIHGISQQSFNLHTPSDCEQLLHRIDQTILQDRAAGETTGVVVVATADQLYGASVGDSDAWLFAQSGNHRLTRGQIRKPFLGSGSSVAVGFSMAPKIGTLLVATDGLWKYTSLEKIQEQIQCKEKPNPPQRLVDLVRLRSCALPDDIALAILDLP